MQDKTEISSSLSSSRFYTVELISISGLSSSIQTSLTDELNRGESKLACPNCRFYSVEFRRRALKSHGLSTSGVKLLFSTKTAIIYHHRPRYLRPMDQPVF